MEGVRPTGSLEGDLTALRALYLATDGKNWTHSWDIDGEISTWHGVTVNSEGRVVALVLVRNNLIGSIPPELGDLGELEELWLQGNQLSGSIPPELGHLGALKFLGLWGNQLSGTIPSELGNLGALQNIYLSWNQLSGAIPPELGNLSALEVLDLSKNQLRAIWDYTGGAEGEHYLLEDSVSSLPRQLRNIIQTSSLSLDNNPWVEPPEAIVDKGKVAIAAYYSALHAEPVVVSRCDLKVVIVGKEGVGKTSLRQSIKAGRATPTAGPEESTVNVAIDVHALDGVNLRIYDCAGQVAYYGLLQLFLTHRAVILLVWDASLDGDDDNALEELGILPWLRALSFRLPGVNTILVGNKCDRRLPSQESAAKAGLAIERATRNWLDDWYRVADHKKICIQEGVSLTSCRHPASSEGQDAEAAGWPCDWRTDFGDALPSKSLLDRLAHSSLNGSPRDLALPFSWSLALTFLDALGVDGRDPISEVRSHMKQDTVIEVEPAAASKAIYGIAYDQLVDMWKDAVGTAFPNPEGALEGALTIREYEGRVVRVGWYVFVDVGWLAKVLEPLLSHKAGPLVNGRLSLGREVQFEGVMLTTREERLSLKCLVELGVLEHTFARVLWGEMAEAVLEILDQVGLTIPHHGGAPGDQLVLLRLSDEPPPEVSRELSQFRGNAAATLTARWEMPLGVPPGAVEQVIAQCCKLGTPTFVWRFGMLLAVCTADGDAPPMPLLVQYSPFEAVPELMVQVQGNDSETAPWALLSCVLSLVRQMTRNFTGLPWGAYLDCPRHPGHPMEISDNGSFREHRMIQDKHACRVCKGFRRGPGVLATQLLEWETMTRTRDVALVFKDAQIRMSRSQQAQSAQGSGADQVSSDGRNGSVINLSSMLNDLTLSQKRAADDASLDPALASVIDEIAVKVALKLRSLRASGDQSDKNLTKTKEVMAERELLQSLVTALCDVQEKLSVVQKEVCDGQKEVRDGLKRFNGELAHIRTPIPADMVLLPPFPDALSEDDRSAKTWIARLQTWQATGKKEGKGFARRELRLFFLCAYDLSLAECGPEGRGYPIKKDRKWATKARPFVKSLLILSSAALRAFLGTAIPIDELTAAWGASIGAAASEGIKDVAAQGIDAACAPQESSAPSLVEVGTKQADPSPAPASTAETTSAELALMKKMVNELEEEGVKAKEGQHFQSFEVTMCLADEKGEGLRWKWVRNKNRAQFVKGH